MLTLLILNSNNNKRANISSSILIVKLIRETNCLPMPYFLSFQFPFVIVFPPRVLPFSLGAYVCVS